MKGRIGMAHGPTLCPDFCFGVSIRVSYNESTEASGEQFDPRRKRSK